MSAKAGETDTKREPLSRARIVACAVAIADAEGIEALSMRRVAHELGATPMALYNHVGGKDELFNEIAGYLLEEIDISAMDFSDWAAAIKTGYTEFRRVLLNHPNLMAILHRKTEMSADALRPIELAMSLFRSAGFTPEEALRAHWTLTGYAMGHVMWQLTNPLLEEDGGVYSLSETIAQQRRALDPHEFPCLLESLPSLEVCDMDAAWEFGIDTIIGGLKAKLATPDS